jgi:hypothetical protein
MSKNEEYHRMKTALQNILEISSDDFSKHQATWGLGIKAGEKEKK